MPLWAIQEKPMHKFSMPEEIIARVVALARRPMFVATFPRETP